MKDRVPDIIFIILMIIFAIIIYKISYSKTLTFIPIAIMIFYLIENKNRILLNKKDI